MATILVAHHVDKRRTLHVENLLFLSQYRIVEAAEARGLIERARRLRPRVVVMPLSLPGMETDGGALRVLKKDPTTRHLPIIALAERDDLREGRRATDFGVDVLVHEPCVPLEILEHVKRCVDADVAHRPLPCAERRRSSDSGDAKKGSRLRDRVSTKLVG